MGAVMNHLFNFLFFAAFAQGFFFTSLFAGPDPETLGIWRNLLQERSNCVTWVSCTVRIEVSAGGRSYPPTEKKLEALGTVLGEDGLIALSLNMMDPTDSILSRMNGPSKVNVNYTEVLILLPDGSEIPADFMLKDEDLDLAFIKPIARPSDSGWKGSFHAVQHDDSIELNLQALDEVVSMGKLGRNLFRQSTLQLRTINAVITKPRHYYVAEDQVPGTPVFDRLGRWIGVAAFRKEAGKPAGVIIVPAPDVMEIAGQARRRAK